MSIKGSTNVNGKSCQLNKQKYIYIFHAIETNISEVGVAIAVGNIYDA